MMSRVDAQANINPRSSFINHVVLKKEQNGIDVIYDASYGRRCENENEWESFEAIKGFGFIGVFKFDDVNGVETKQWLLYYSQNNHLNTTELNFIKQ